MNPFRKTIIVAAVGAFALTACTESGPRQNNGAAIGAALGGIFGATRTGGDLGSAAVGAALGGMIGGAVGQQLDIQAGDLRSSMGNSDITVVNTGSELIVTMPNDILFATGSSNVGSGLRNDLAALASNLEDYPDSTVRVIGHTDNVGTAGSNLTLSRDRASSVADILIGNGIRSSRIATIGRGEDEPVASNLNSSGRAQNRRVEIIIRPN